jgi:hypothetical protein
VSFGARGWSDYTIHKDDERKTNYLKRHKHDPVSIKTPGGLARDLLWSETNLPKAVKFASKKHGVKIILK